MTCDHVPTELVELGDEIDASDGYDPLDRTNGLKDPQCDARSDSELLGDRCQSPRPR